MFWLSGTSLTCFLILQNRRLSPVNLPILLLSKAPIKINDYFRWELSKNLNRSWSDWNREAATEGVLQEKKFLAISQNSQENTSARASFLIKLQASGLQLYLKKRLWRRCFPVNFAKFLIRTPFLQNTSGQLLQQPAKESTTKKAITGVL